MWRTFKLKKTRFNYNKVIDDQYLPQDHSRQTTAVSCVRKIIRENKNIKTMMDLGCGAGKSVDFFHRLNSEINWVGLDIEDSPQVNRRTRNDVEFCSYDGINIPFEDNYFDLIYSNQVMEHVRNPRELLKEVARVLKPNGYFVGSTSQLETYHSFSVWNFTPYGFKILIEDAELQLTEIRPSIDGLTMLLRTGFGRPNFFGRWWRKESPLNKLIGLIGRMSKKNHRQINSAKLLLCGQFTFIVRKVVTSPDEISL